MTLQYGVEVENAKGIGKTPGAKARRERKREREGTRSAWNLARRAFTLVELLVVVAIIAALTAIILPVLSQARARGRETDCRSHMHQIGLALQMYRDDYDELPPHLSTLAPAYISDPRLFICPSDPQKGHQKGNDFLEGDLYLKSGVSYDYLPNWTEAVKLGWWRPGPHHGPGRWDALTPISQCAWHWATQFNRDQSGGNLPGSKGWMFVLTAGGSVRRYRVETSLQTFTPDNLR